MENSGIESLVDLIERIEINEENREQIKEIKKFIEEENYSICHPVLGCPDRGIFCIYHQLLPEGNH